MVDSGADLQVDGLVEPPQSRRTSMLPSFNGSESPAAMRATAWVILRVTNCVPRSGLSWLCSFAKQACTPWLSRNSATATSAAALATA